MPQGFHYQFRAYTNWLRDELPPIDFQFLFNLKRTLRYNSLLSQNHPRITPTYDLLATPRHIFPPFQRIREANQGTHDNHFCLPISYMPIFDEADSVKSEPSEPAPFPSDNEDKDI